MDGLEHQRDASVAADALRHNTALDLHCASLDDEWVLGTALGRADRMSVGYGAGHLVVVRHVGAPRHPAFRPRFQRSGARCPPRLLPLLQAYTVSAGAWVIFSRHAGADGRSALGSGKTGSLGGRGGLFRNTYAGGWTRGSSTGQARR